MKPRTIYFSFLVRLWSDEQQAGGEGESPAWEGEVTHIQSGSKVLFQDMDQLRHYLQEHLDKEDQFED